MLCCTFHLFKRRQKQGDLEGGLRGWNRHLDWDGVGNVGEVSVPFVMSQRVLKGTRTWYFSIHSPKKVDQANSVKDGIF